MTIEFYGDENITFWRETPIKVGVLATQAYYVPRVVEMARLLGCESPDPDKERILALTLTLFPEIMYV